MLVYSKPYYRNLILDNRIIDYTLDQEIRLKKKLDLELKVLVLKFLILSSGVYFLGCRYHEGMILFPFLPEWLSWIKISTFSIFLALAFLISHLVLQKEFYRLKMDEKIADVDIMIGLVGGIIGSKIFFAIEIYSQLDSFSEAMSALFSRGGLTWYGGFILVVSLLYLMARHYKIAPGKIFDINIPPLAIGYAVGRLACVASGDGCYGIKCPYNLPAPFAMSFPNGANPWSNIVSMYGDENVVVYNTPLFESLFSFLLFIFFWKVRKKDWPNGVKSAIFTIAHAVFRYFIEFIRLNPKDVFGMSQAQFVSICLFILGLAYLAYKKTAIVESLKKA